MRKQSQQRNLHSALSVWAFTTILAVTQIALARADEHHPLLQIERDVEEWQMSRLAQVQAEPLNKLAPFTTDGCSGGLSDGWSSLSKLFPAFKTKFGDAPPYEACCVEHDRAYWRGETEQGYRKRLQADETLRACVMEYGKQHRQAFAKEFAVSEETVEKNFSLTANLMYHAVRLGGQPCSYLPWRWGYGWADCPLLSPADAAVEK
jgi:hypothetical protein